MQEVRQAIIKAYTAYQNTEHLRLVTDIQRVDVGASNSGEELLDFVKLANIWQAPMYTITVHALGDVFGNKASAAVSIYKHPRSDGLDVEFCIVGLYSDELDGAESKYQLFNTMVSNDKPEEVIAECSGCLFVMPRNSRFFIVSAWYRILSRSWLQSCRQAPSYCCTSDAGCGLWEVRYKGGSAASFRQAIRSSGHSSFGSSFQRLVAIQ